MQLYTVHGLTNHGNIVGAYALLPNKRRAENIEMLTEIQRLTRNAMPHSLMADFESSMLSALNQIYSGIPQVGCLFHLAKNVFRRLQDIGLQQNYVTDPLFRGNTCIIVVLMSSLFLIILKLITLESCEEADVCCRFSLTKCGICVIGS